MSDEKTIAHLRKQLDEARKAKEACIRALHASRDTSIAWIFYLADAERESQLREAIYRKGGTP